MIPGFGAHYRTYRLLTALDRLRGLPAGTSVSITKAAHLLGTREKTVRELLQRFEPTVDTTSSKIDARVLQRVVHKLYESRKQR